MKSTVEERASYWLQQKWSYEVPTQLYDIFLEALQEERDMALEEAAKTVEAEIGRRPVQSRAATAHDIRTLKSNYE